jgi:hypothetical protein
MKTLTTLAAVAALIAGLSIANAQGTTMPLTPSPSTSNGGASNLEHAMGNGKFCIKGTNDALNCQYASLSACRKAASGTETCQANPGSTTGSGSSSKY